MDAAGPDTMSFDELVPSRPARSRQAYADLARIACRWLPWRARLACRARRRLTADEIRGLTSGLLASHQPALGKTSFIEWLNENGSTLGRAYANELDRHFRRPKASAHA
jgi:NADH dehydrogenase